LGLDAVGGLEAQMFNKPQKHNRSANVEFSTSAPIAFKPLLCPSAFFPSVHFVSVCRVLVRWLGSSFALLALICVSAKMQMC